MICVFDGGGGVICFARMVQSGAFQYRRPRQNRGGGFLRAILPSWRKDDRRLFRWAGRPAGQARPAPGQLARPKPAEEAPLGQDRPYSRTLSLDRRAPPLPPIEFFALSIASSGPEMRDGRTPTDVLTNSLEELLVGPTAAQTNHDAPTTDHHRCSDLDEKQAPRRRLSFTQRVAATTSILILLARRFR